MTTQSYGWNLQQLQHLQNNDNQAQRVHKNLQAMLKNKT